MGACTLLADMFGAFLEVIVTFSLQPHLKGCGGFIFGRICCWVLVRSCSANRFTASALSVVKLCNPMQGWKQNPVRQARLPIITRLYWVYFYSPSDHRLWQKSSFKYRKCYASDCQSLFFSCTIARDTNTDRHQCNSHLCSRAALNYSAIDTVCLPTCWRTKNRGWILLSRLSDCFPTVESFSYSCSSYFHIVLLLVNYDIYHTCYDWLLPFSQISWRMLCVFSASEPLDERSNGQKPRRSPLQTLYDGDQVSASNQVLPTWMQNSLQCCFKGLELSLTCFLGIRGAVWRQKMSILGCYCWIQTSTTMAGRFLTLNWKAKTTSNRQF